MNEREPVRVKPFTHYHNYLLHSKYNVPFAR